MFISKSHYKEIKNELEHKQKSCADLIEKNLKLEKELSQAKDLKDILNKFSGLLTGEGITFNTVSGGWSLNLPDHVLQYTEDILGGKVIKQEGTKALVIDKNGNVKTGLTKQKPDKGYSYKLIRQ